ncbi:ribosomal RNA-processing protein 7-domain-containing protein [Dipodascopsis uninucleata]
MAKKSNMKSIKRTSGYDSSPLIINGYFVVPVLLRVSQTAFIRSRSGGNSDEATDNCATHYLYIRKHDDHSGSEYASSTFFMANIPIDATTSHIRTLFSSLCAVSDPKLAAVKFLEAPTSSSIIIPTTDSLKTSSLTPIRKIWPSCSAAHISFSESAAFAKALSALKRTRAQPIEWITDGTEDPTACGTARYLAIHRRLYVNSEILQNAIDAYMAEFNKTEAQREREAKRKRMTPDEDGFVTVARNVGRSGAGISNDFTKEEAKKKLRKVELKDFYRFQIRQQKKDRMNELIKNFKNDQEKIKELKERKKFNPFSSKLS